MNRYIFLKIIVLLLWVSGCNSNKKWTPEQSQAVYNDCTVRAEKFVGEAENAQYCKCVLEHIKKGYPYYEDIKQLIDENNSQYWDIIELQIAQCAQTNFIEGIKNLDSTRKKRLQSDITQWNKTNENKFRKAIINIIPPQVKNKVNQEQFCLCMLQRAKYQYPQFDSISILLKKRELLEQAFANDLPSCVVHSIKNEGTK